MINTNTVMVVAVSTAIALMLAARFKPEWGV